MRDRETDKRVEKRQADPDEEKSGRERGEKDAVGLPPHKACLLRPGLIASKGESRMLPSESRPRCFPRTILGDNRLEPQICTRSALC